MCGQVSCIGASYLQIPEKIFDTQKGLKTHSPGKYQASVNFDPLSLTICVYPFFLDLYNPLYSFPPNHR